jgi:hypothetical protein
MPDEPQGEPAEHVIAPPENTQSPPDNQQVTPSAGAGDTTQSVPAVVAAPPP